MSPAPRIRRIHHVALRCNDAMETVEWYSKHLSMTLVLTLSDADMAQTTTQSPCIQVFLDAGQGSMLAFCEMPNYAPISVDRSLPSCAQLISLQVDSVETLVEIKNRLELASICVTGPTNHAAFRAVCFFDPNGHRVELMALNEPEGELRHDGDRQWRKLEQWTQTTRMRSNSAWSTGDEANY